MPMEPGWLLIAEDLPRDGEEQGILLPIGVESIFHSKGRIYSQKGRAFACPCEVLIPEAPDQPTRIGGNAYSVVTTTDVKIMSALTT